jgi:hypothetical protein
VPTGGQNAESDINLWVSAASSASYASDHFQCLGLSRSNAQQKADQALGSDFQLRLRNARSALERRYGAVAVDDQAGFIPIGYKRTRERCRKVRNIVQDAGSALAELERRLGAN